MGDLTNFLKSQNINPSEYLVPTKDPIPKVNQPSFGKYNRTFEGDIRDIDFAGDSNLTSLDAEKNDIRARTQRSLSKAFNTLGQGIGTFTTATLSTAATLGGGIAALGAEAATLGEAEGLDIMLNNPVMKGISDLDKYIKEDMLPTYYTKEQQNSLLSAATGTDLVNGVGFMLSAMLPAAGITKALGGISKLGILAKAGKLESTLAKAVAQGTIKAEEAAKALKFGEFMAKVPSITGALVGRIGESAMEANGVYDSVKQDLLSEREKAQYELLNYGETSHPEFASLTEEEIEKRAKSNRDKVLAGNMLLGLSDVAQYTRWFKPSGLADDIVKNGLGYAIKKRGKAELVKSFMGEALQEAGEEGFQYLLQKGGEQNAKDGNGFIADVMGATGDLFTTTEGQKSMLLGAVLGGGASSIAGARNSKEKAKQLNAMVSQLNSESGIVNDKYIVNPDGQYVLNPQYAKQTAQFFNLEQQRKEALENNDTETAELIEKQQFASLVQNRVQNDKFDDLIDELETLAKTDDVELAQYFGNNPTDKEGNKLSASQVAQTKIQQAKEIKKTIDGLNLIPEYNSLTLQAKQIFLDHMLTQDNLLSQIQKIDAKISTLEGEKTYIIPTTQGITNKETEKKNPIAEKQIAELKQNRDLYAEQYDNLNNFITRALAKPEIVEQKVAKKEEEQTDILSKEIEKEEEFQENAEDKLNNIKQYATTPTIIDVNGEKVEVLNKDGVLIDTSTGESVEDAVLSEIKNGIIETEESDNIEDPIEEYDENEVPQDFDGAKKPSIHSTSTSAHQRDGNTRFPEYNSSVDNAETYLRYAYTIAHEKIAKWFSNPKNTPGEGKVFTAKLSKGDINIEMLNNINKARKNRVPKLEPLTLEDLYTPAFMPLRMTLYENGKVVQASKESAIHYHDVDFFFNTSEYEKMKEDLKPEELEIAVNNKLKELVTFRIKLIENLEEVTLPVILKSKGIVNFLPNTEGKKQVLSFGKVMPKFNSKTDLGVVTSIDETGGATISLENGSVMYLEQHSFSIGQTVVKTLAADNTDYFVSTTKNKYSPEIMDAMEELLLHKLTEGNTIKIGKTEYVIKGEQNNRGLLDTIMYLGNKNSKEKQIFFMKNGNINIAGKQYTASQVEEVKAILRPKLEAYHSYPKYTKGELERGQVALMEDGKLTVKPYKSVLLNEKNPLIGVNIDPEAPFINSYFTFDEPIFPNKETSKPYVEELEGEIVGTINDSGFMETVSNQSSQVEPDNITINNKNVSESEVPESVVTPENKEGDVSEKVSEISLESKPSVEIVPDNSNVINHLEEKEAECKTGKGFKLNLLPKK